MPKPRSAIKWQNYELKRLEAGIEKEITENEDITVSSDKRTKLEDCIVRKEERQDQQERELRWKKVNEDIELRSEGVEPLLDSLSLSFLFFYII